MLVIVVFCYYCFWKPLKGLFLVNIVFRQNYLISKVNYITWCKQENNKKMLTFFRLFSSKLISLTNDMWICMFYSNEKAIVIVNVHSPNNEWTLPNSVKFGGQNYKCSCSFFQVTGKSNKKEIGFTMTENMYYVVTCHFGSMCSR